MSYAPSRVIYIDIDDTLIRNFGSRGWRAMFSQQRLVDDFSDLAPA